MCPCVSLYKGMQICVVGPEEAGRGIGSLGAVGYRHLGTSHSECWNLNSSPHD